jgi:hypothetical protein
MQDSAMQATAVPVAGGQQLGHRIGLHLPREGRMLARDKTQLALAEGRDVDAAIAAARCEEHGPTLRGLGRRPSRRVPLLASATCPRQLLAGAVGSSAPWMRKVLP